MVFSSNIFVFYFLPAVLLLYLLAELSNKLWLKNTVVLIASLVFYAWGGVKYLLLLLGLVVINYVSGLLIYYTRYKKTFLALGLMADVLNLLFFKYLNFIIDNVESAVQHFGNAEFTFGLAQIALPIGISFFTFQIMSYLVDVYRNEVPAQKNIAWLTLYIMMFPQLIAGPIVRYSDVNNEIACRKTTLDMVEKGIKRFIIGFAKKVFIANCMGAMADAVFAIKGEFNSLYAWLGAISYSMQIFFDFSAYSDMAIGLGLIFGFHFNENFEYPYISTSIQEFWRRWHISLSTWFRDYVYIPLGGNRKGKIRTYINLSIVFLLTGIWHGAAWQFIVWGLFHGLFMLIERAGLGKLLKKIPAFFAHIYTLLIIIVGWVFFRADNLTKALAFLKNMFSFNFKQFTNEATVTQATHLFWVVGVIAILASTPLFKKLGQTKLAQVKWIGYVGYLLLMIITVIYLSGLTYNPFIYFKF